MPDSPSPPRLNTVAAVGILVCAFLGWFFGGTQIALNNLIQNGVLDVLDQSGSIDQELYGELTAKLRNNSATADELARMEQWSPLVKKWYAWLQCAFLFGAALGGYIFGKLGDRLGRTRTLGIAIIWFSAFTGLTWFAAGPEQLFVMRFLACLGIGGTWPNGVALVSEVWANTARPVLASAIGMAGNLGIFTMSNLSRVFAENDVSWKMGLLANTAPILLGATILAFLPESPGWRLNSSAPTQQKPSVFRKPHLKVTLIGIALPTIPLIGGWGSANWMVPWAEDEGKSIGDGTLAPRVVMYRSLASIVGSLLAGLIAVTLGRRRTYLIAAVAAFVSAQIAFWFTSPHDQAFFVLAAVLGIFNGIFFGWLPFFLPELFPTRIRATGTGVSFNYGRILTALSIFGTGYILGSFNHDYAAIGRITSFVFLLGVVAIYFAPDTSKRDMAE